MAVPPTLDLIADHAPGAPLLVGLSGGLDSSVLLHRLAADPALRARRLRAIHVHHGLSADADAWSAHCGEVCAALGVPLALAHVHVARDGGQGLEAAARDARHAAFAAALAPGEVLVLGHHRDDQAETFLLRALRGSGVDGLAAMRPWRAYAHGWLWRPLLDQPRQALLAWAQAQGFSWIEDPANAHAQHDRNFLRHQVLPLLASRWPQAGAVLARSAALQAEAADLLAQEDARALAMAASLDPACLSVAGLQALPVARRARVLRRWIASLGMPPLPAEGVAQLEAMIGQPPRDGRSPRFAWEHVQIRLWRGLLWALRPRPALPAHWQADWDGTGALALPGGGRLWLERVAPDPGHDAPTPAPAMPLRVHARRGGERIILPGRAHSHALKDVLLALGVPPWLRARAPLLSTADGQLLAAGDLVLSAAMQRWQRAAGLRLRWQRDGHDDLHS